MDLERLLRPSTTNLPQSPHSVALPTRPAERPRSSGFSSIHHLGSAQSVASLDPPGGTTIRAAALQNCCWTSGVPLDSPMQIRRRAAESLKVFYSTRIAPVNVKVQKQSPLYDVFVDFSIREVGEHAHLVTYPFEEDFNEILAADGKTIACNSAFESSKIRLFRIATIDGGDSMQVLNMAILPRPEFDLPIFCADFFSTSTNHIIVLDLNPLYDIEKNKWYKEKYYSGLMPLVNKYIELLPWGQKLTTESLQFFSPLVIWTKLESRQDVQETVYLAFKEYLKAWLELMDKVEPTTNPAEISQNQQAQHRYLLWRATKDPGRPLLSRLFGKDRCETYIMEFLYNGLKSMGNKGFLDYFPEYRCGDGSIKKERSVIGKSCLYRPWDKDGNYIGDKRGVIGDLSKF